MREYRGGEADCRPAELGGVHGVIESGARFGMNATPAVANSVALRLVAQRNGRIGNFMASGCSCGVRDYDSDV